VKGGKKRKEKKKVYVCNGKGSVPSRSMRRAKVSCQGRIMRLQVNGGKPAGGEKDGLGKELAIPRALALRI